jgi:hypothetical protein
MAEENPGYEKTDVNVTKIVGIAIVIVVFLAAILVFLNEFFIFEKEEMVSEAAQQVSSKLRELRAHEDEVLNSYKVLDAKNGIYQIPIDRAMKLVADEAYKNSVKK